jgi:tRNA(Ile)-lysidine synthase
MLELPELGGTLQMTQRRGAGISLERLMAAPVSIRLRRGGERFQPDARRPRRSLKNLLQEARVPPWVRDRLPLLYSGATLVYVPGIGIDAAYVAAGRELGVEPSWRAP